MKKDREIKRNIQREKDREINIDRQVKREGQKG